MHLHSLAQLQLFLHFGEFGLVVAFHFGELVIVVGETVVLFLLVVLAYDLSVFNVLLLQVH